MITSCYLMTNLSKKKGMQRRFFLYSLLSALIHFTIVVIFSFASTSKPQQSYDAEPLIISFKSPDTLKPYIQSTITITTPSSKKQKKQNLLPPGQSSTVLNRDYYYRAQELDAMPQITQKTEPEYPLQAKENGITGHVKVELFIDEEGKVVTIDVLESTPPGVFEPPSIKAFSNQLFVPGQIKAIPVKSRIITTIRFEETPPTANP